MKKTTTIKNLKKYNNKTKKNKHKKIKSLTPLKVRKMSKEIANSFSYDNLAPYKLAKGLKSYSPTINRELVTLKSISREELGDCNIENAFNLKEPLQIRIPKLKRCFVYNTPEAKKFLLHNLSADKHIDIKKVVPPIQAQANCWFNAMFVTFFVSDKGRKFFHFLRQLMIEGEQKNGSKIPPHLQDAFALLNFGIDACLTGNKFAYTLDTNSIIHKIYTSIPNSYKKDYPLIVDVNKAGNPLFYYFSIINYLNDNSIIVLFVSNVNHENWKKKIEDSVKVMSHLPHIVVLEVYDETAANFITKPYSFTVNEAKYEIDSAVIRDNSKQHFCSTITGEGKEMAYDGMSFHRMVPMEWKHKMNKKDFTWEFEGTKDFDGTPLQWNFTKDYQLLMYYRVK
jgi:hypothetical protein